jgi:chalcone isomerase-like protein
MKTIAGFALLALAGAALAAPKTATKDTARLVDGRPLTMVGQGTRVKDGEKLYDMQMWIDEEDGRRAFPALAMRASGRDKAHLTRGDHGPAFLVWGRFTKVAVFKFAKAMPAAAVRDEVQGAIDDVKGADAVVAMFGADADAGDEWVLTTHDDGRMELRTGEAKGDKKEAPQSPKLERALWNVWLGAKPVSVDLRRQLIERLDSLGR